MSGPKIVGAAMTRFGKFVDRSLRSLAEEAALGAIADAGLSATDVGLVAFGNAAAGVVTGQEMIRGQTALGGTGLAGSAMIDVENACASGSSAFHVAWMGVTSGAYDVAVAVGAEKMTHRDKRRANAALARAVDVDALIEQRGEEVLGVGAGAMFMDIYASEARDYMAASGATKADFARAASKAFSHGRLNPRAQYCASYSLEQVLASREIVDPLHLLMCSPIGDGAAAVVVVSDSFARRRGLAGVGVVATAVRSGQIGTSKDLEERTARAAYEQAGIGPEDLDVVEVHDAASPAELIATEVLGLAKPGEGPALLASGATALGGRVPVNPSGGLVSRGHPIGATGCAQLVELYDQLMGRAGDRQVDAARVGLAHNCGGWLGNDGAACVITVLCR